jgi:hypothetical protein
MPLSKCLVTSVRSMYEHLQCLITRLIMYFVYPSSKFSTDLKMATHIRHYKEVIHADVTMHYNHIIMHYNGWLYVVLPNVHKLSKW